MNKDTQIDQLRQINSHLTSSTEHAVKVNEAMIKSLKNQTETLTDDEHTILIVALTQSSQHLTDKMAIYTDQGDIKGQERCQERIGKLNNLLIKLDLMLGDAINT